MQLCFVLNKVHTSIEHLSKMVTALQIRMFPDIQKTVKYAKMLERAGAWLVAVHGRTREQKDAKQVRADWNAIRASLQQDSSHI